MEIFRFCIFLFVYFFSYNKIASGFRCDYAECTCMDDMLTYVGVTAPRFKYRATVTMLYMDNVQVVNLLDVINNLPNLRYLSLMNMKYFNCKWLKELPKDVYIRTNMCLNLSTITRYSPTNQSVIGKTEREDKVSKQIPNQIDKQIDKMLPTPYSSTFHSVTEMSDREVSNQITEQTDKMLSTPDHSNVNLQ